MINIQNTERSINLWNSGVSPPRSAAAVIDEGNISDHGRKLEEVVLDPGPEQLLMNNSHDGKSINISYTSFIISNVLMVML